MRWMVILCAAAPLAYGADPSEVEKSETTEPVAAESAEPAPEPEGDFVGAEEAELFKQLGYSRRKYEGEMMWCRREGDVLPGSRLKPQVCRTADQVRALGETPRKARKPRDRDAE